MAQSESDPLADLMLFRGLSAPELARVRSLTTRVDLAAGTEFITQGESGREFFILLDGAVSVHKDGEMVANGGPGDFFGELGVVSGLPRSASVRADTDVTVDVLNRREFSALLDADPRIAKKILISATERLDDVDDDPLR